MRMNPFKLPHSLAYAILAAFGFLFAVVLTSLSAAEKSIVFIPKPFLPVAELAEHRLAIENMQNLLEQKKHFEFYNVAQKFIHESQENLHQEKLFEPKTREEVMAREWVCYLIAGAPLMEMEEFFILGQLPEKDDLLVDLFAKTTVTGMIQDTARGVRRESEKKSYKLRNGIDYKELFIPAEIRKIEIAHVAYYAAILKGQREAYRKASVARKVDGYLRTPGYGITPITFPSNSVMTANGIQAADENARKEDAKNNPNIAYNLFRLKSRRYSTLTSSGMPWGDANKKSFARLVVDCFPNDGASVREYFKKAGFDSDLATADALQSVFPRMKRTAWIFVGLPDEEATEKFLTTNAFLKDPAIKNELEEINKATKEAEALLKRATKRFNLLEAKLSEESTAGAHREHHKKAREAIESQLRTAAASDNPQTWVALRKAEIALFSKLELQLVLQLQATKNPALLPPMQKYLKWVVAEKEILKTEKPPKSWKDWQNNSKWTPEPTFPHTLPRQN